MDGYEAGSASASSSSRGGAVAHESGWGATRPNVSGSDRT
jgi:hypothetical protein